MFINYTIKKYNVHTWPFSWHEKIKHGYYTSTDVEAMHKFFYSVDVVYKRKQFVSKTVLTLVEKNFNLKLTNIVQGLFINKTYENGKLHTFIVISALCA